MHSLINVKTCNNNNNNNKIIKCEHTIMISTHARQRVIYNQL